MLPVPPGAGSRRESRFVRVSISNIVSNGSLNTSLSVVVVVMIVICSRRGGWKSNIYNYRDASSDNTSGNHHLLK